MMLEQCYQEKNNTEKSNYSNQDFAQTKRPLRLCVMAYSRLRKFRVNLNVSR